MLVARILLITVLVTLLTFCVALFLGIVGIMLVDMIGKGGINLASAYRRVAIPAGAVALVVALCTSATTEIKRYGRARALVRSQEDARQIRDG